MVGITLSSEQIHQAPAEVRRWLEQQIASSLGFYPRTPPVEAPARRLLACSPEQAGVILSQIQGFLPVTAVFFELGREPAAATAQGLRALRLDEIGRHARLQTTDQVVACLTAIDAALQRATGQPDAALTALDGAGHCLVADVTAHSILALWQEIIASRDLPHPEAASPPEMPQPAAAPLQAPYTMSMPAFVAPQQPGMAIDDAQAPAIPA